MCDELVFAQPQRSMLTLSFYLFFPMCLMCLNCLMLQSNVVEPSIGTTSRRSFEIGTEIVGT
jgi:hypothetical protein